MTKASPAIRLGLVGCGHWGKNYLRVLNSLPGVNLVMASDRSPEILARKRERYPDVEFTNDALGIFNSGKCNAVVIATPATTHFTLVKAALQADLDVLVEKPLTLEVDQAEELVALAAERSRILFVAHTFLFNSNVAAVKQMIEQGVLGDIFYLKFRRTHLGLIRNDVNAVWDLAPHDISLCLHLLGESPTRVQAIGGMPLHSGREDVAFINLAFPNDVVASIHVSWVDSNKARRLEIVGSKARIVFDDMDLQEPVRLFHKGVSPCEPSAEADSFGDFKYIFRNGDVVSPYIEAQEPLQNQCNQFVRDCQERRVPISGGELGKEVVRILCAVDSALLAPA